MKKRIALVLVLTMILTLGSAMTVFAKTTKKSTSQPSVSKTAMVKNFYTSKSLRCKVSLPVPLAKKVKVSAVKSFKDGKLKFQEIHFVGTINKTKLDMFVIGRVNKKTTAKQFEKINPLAHYIKTKGNYTYYLQVTEQYPARELKAFAKLINTYVDTKNIKIATF